MIARAAAALLAALIVRGACASTPQDYAYVFPIDAAADGAGSSAWRVELSPEVYAWVQDAGLRDIEVFNAANQPVPLARIAFEPAATRREKRVPLPVLALPASAAATASDLRLVIDRDADGRLRRIDAGDRAPVKTESRDWLLDASSVDGAIDRIVLSWTGPTDGVVARFSVAAGDDLESWRDTGGGTVLALEQNGARLERRDIALGGVRAKYLRLHRIDDGAELAGLAAEAHSIEHDAAAPKRAWANATPLAAARDETSRSDQARFDYTLASALPVERARIELAGDNSLAPLVLLARVPNRNGWTRIAEVTAFRLREGDETLRNGDVGLPASERLREFRIESPTPLTTPPTLTFGYRPDSFVFLAEGDGPYVLAAGSATARRSDYPVDAALATLRAKLGRDWQPPLATLGAAEVSAGNAALTAPAPPIPWRRWVLWAVLVAGALVVAGFAVSLLRGATRPPPE